MKKIALLAALGALVVAVPASAHSSIRPHHHPPRVCRARNDRYSARGTLTTWSLTKNADGTWSGTLVLDVLHGNKHAAPSIGTETTYTVTDAAVHFGPKATDPPVAGARVRVIGRILELGRRCDDATYTATPTITRIQVHAPAAS